MISSGDRRSSITAALKNAIDWASRPAQGEPPLVAFQGKVAAIMSASPDGRGGLRGPVRVLAILGNIGVLVLPDQVALPSAFEAFAEDGSLKDEKKHGGFAVLGTKLVETLQKLAR